MSVVMKHLSGELQGESLLDALKEIRRKKLEGGESLVDLSMINPDLPPPRLLLDRLVEASMKGENHRYAVSRGVRKLREAFASKYKTRFGVAIDPENEVCVTFGTKDALLDVFQVVCKTGDTILLPTPTYPAHSFLAEHLGLRCVFFSVAGTEEEVIARIKEVCTKEKVKVILLNYPHNPTGITASRSLLSSIVTFAQQEGIFLLNDFVYGELTYSPLGAQSVLSSNGKKGVCETYSLSKSYGVPGWRVGALLGDEEVVRKVALLKSYVDYGIFLPLQYASASALNAQGDIVQPLRMTYERRAKVLVEMVRSAGATAEMPAAGASVWVQLPEGKRSPNLTLSLADSHGILLMPGDQFGRQYNQFVRIAAVAAEDKLRAAGVALKEVLVS